MIYSYEASFDIKTPEWDKLFRVYDTFRFNHESLQAMLSEQKGSIYRIYFPTLQRSYIGQTTRNPKERLSSHKGASNSLGNALNTQPYEFSVLLTNVPKSWLNFAECLKIREHTSLYPEGFNFQLECSEPRSYRRQEVE